jgi:type I restriction enzyme, S subunit
MKMKLRDGWQRAKFGDVVRNVSEAVADPVAAGLERAVGLEHLDSGELAITRWASVDGLTFTRRFRAGQVLYGRRRVYQRKAAVPDFGGVCSGDIYVLEPSSDAILPDLLPFIVQSESFHEYALRTSAGSLSPRTKWTDLAKYEFDLPPIDEQREIAGLMWAAEATRRATDRVLAASVAVRGAVVSAGTQSAKDTVRLGDVADVSYGITLNSRRAELPVSRPYLRVANVHRGSLDLGEIKLVRCSEKESLAYSLAAGDILVVEGHASMTEVGRAALWLGEIDDCLHQNHLIRVRVIDGFNPGVVAELLNGPTGRLYFRSRAKSTSGLSTINSTVVKEFPLPVLDAPDLLEMINKLEAIDALAASLLRARQSELALRGQLSESLMSAPS